MAAADFRQAPSHPGQRFGVFLKHPFAKVLLGAFAVLLVWWLVYPAVKVFEGTKAAASDVIGTYVATDGSSVVLDGASGRYSLPGPEVWDFSYTFEAGLLSCVDGPSSFELRYLSDARLYDYSRHVFLGRVVDGPAA